MRRSRVRFPSRAPTEPLVTAGPLARGGGCARRAGATVVDQDGFTDTTDSAARITASPGIRDELLALLDTAAVRGG
jgi:hypothetical protein